MSAAPEPNSDGSAIPELYYTGFLGLYVIGLHNGRKGIGFVWSWNEKGENLLEFELVCLFGKGAWHQDDYHPRA